MTQHAFAIACLFSKQKVLPRCPPHQHQVLTPGRYMGGQVNGRCQQAFQGNDLAPFHPTARPDHQVHQTKPDPLRRIGWGTELIQNLNFHLHMEQITRYKKLTVDQGG
jgi:hypothetical protein